MIVVLEAIEDVAAGQVKCFEREGIAALAVQPDEFEEWVSGLVENEIAATELFLVGMSDQTDRIIHLIRQRPSGAIMVIGNTRKLEETLRFFAMGVDDVVHRPVHVLEIMARTRAIDRRASSYKNSFQIGGITIPGHGGDPIVAGDRLVLPRRERRILACLARARGQWVSKRQIFLQVYGLMSDVQDESVIESHICRLRRRLKLRLEVDLIESQRFYGYRLVDKQAECIHRPDAFSPPIPEYTMETARFVSGNTKLT